MKELSSGFHQLGIKEVTASFGIHQYRFNEDLLDDGIHAADQAMYHSKTNRRNQVTSYRGLILEKSAPSKVSEN